MMDGNQMGGMQQQAPSPPIREDQIASAVKFLQHEKVANATHEQKSAFLSKKGMTDEEITEAFKRVSGTPTPSAPAQAPPTPMQQQYTPQQQSPQMMYAPPYQQQYAPYPQYYAPPPQIRARETFWSFISSFILPILAALGATSALYALIKKFFPQITNMLGIEETPHRLTDVRSPAVGTPRRPFEDPTPTPADASAIRQELADVKSEFRKLQGASEDLVKSVKERQQENEELKTMVSSLTEKMDKKPALDLAPASINALASLLAKSVKEQGGAGLGDSITSSALDSSVIKPDQSGDLGDAVRAVIEGCSSVTAAKKLLSTLGLIFSNLIMHPEIDKYRKLNRTSPRFANQFLAGSAEVRLLHLAGFEEMGNTFVFKSDDLCPVQAVKQFIDSYMGKVEEIFHQKGSATPTTLATSMDASKSPDEKHVNVELTSPRAPPASSEQASQVQEQQEETQKEQQPDPAPVQTPAKPWMSNVSQRHKVTLPQEEQTEPEATKPDETTA